MATLDAHQPNDGADNHKDHATKPDSLNLVDLHKGEAPKPNEQQNLSQQQKSVEQSPLHQVTVNHDEGAEPKPAGPNKPSAAAEILKPVPIHHDDGGVLGAVGGFFSSVKDRVESEASKVVHNPLEAAKDLALATPVGEVASYAASHAQEIEAAAKNAASGVARVSEDLATGAWNEIKNHPGELAKDAAIGLAFGAAAVVAPEVVLPVAAAMLAEQAIAHGRGDSLDMSHPLDMMKTIGRQLVDPLGDAKALVKTGSDLVSGTEQLGHDVKVDYAPDGYSKADIAKAHTDIQGVGAFGTELAAGVAGGVAGGWLASTVRTAMASEAAAGDSTAASGAKVSEGDRTPVPEKPVEMNPEQIKSLVADRAQSNGVLNMVKSGDVKYNVEHINPETDPYGRVFSSTERPMTLQNDVSVQTPSGVVELKAGTTLPNGVQFSPGGDVSVAENGAVKFSGGKLITPEGGVKLADGTVIKSGDLVPTDGGSIPSVALDKGAIAKVNENILQRPSIDLSTGQPRIDTYAQSDATLAKKMVPSGNDGVWTPKVDPEHPTVVKAVPLNDSDRVSFMASYNEQVSNGAATHVVVSEGPDGSLVPQYLLSKQDAWETYGPADAATKTYFDSQVGAVSKQVGFEVPHAPANATVMKAVEAAASKTSK